MKYCKLTGITMIAVLACTSPLFGESLTVEPQRPNVNRAFSVDKEAKVRALRTMETREAFDGLKGPDFMVDRALTYKAIHAAFGRKRAEAVAYAQNYLRLPLIEVIEGRRVTRVRNFNIAKKVFEVFPQESSPRLVSLYDRSDSVTRGNVIRASGGIAGGTPVREMLIKALDDKAAAEEKTPEMLGEPLRVCDIAYNQLVLRYRIRGVLRTVSSAHDMETRDYHINILKSRL